MNPTDEIEHRSFGAWQFFDDYAIQPCCCDLVSQPPCAPCQARAYLGRSQGRGDGD